MVSAAATDLRHPGNPIPAWAYAGHTMSTRVLTAVAWPYANGPRHIGHVSGFGVPSDVFSRYRRMAGDQVLMVSGTDEHGTPIQVQADAEGLTPRQLADKYNRRDQSRTCRASASPTTSSPAPPRRNHYEVVQNLFLALHRNGYVVAKSAMGAISPSTGRTLPDRYVEGTCPICGYAAARGDQCDNCGNQLDPTDLINPRVEDQRGDPGVRRDRALLPRPARVRRVARAAGWPPAPTGGPTCSSSPPTCVEDLKPRAITRDLDWGVPIPLDGWRDQPMKRLYVWFDAVIGYLSASVEWARRGPRPRRLEAVVERPRRPELLLHGQGQHRLPLGDLARAAARPERAGRPRRHPGRVRHAEPAERDRVVGVPHDERLEVLDEPRHGHLRRRLPQGVRARRPALLHRGRRAREPGHRLHLGRVRPPHQLRAGQRVGQPRQPVDLDGAQERRRDPEAGRARRRRRRAARRLPRRVRHRRRAARAQPVQAGGRRGDAGGVGGQPVPVGPGAVEAQATIPTGATRSCTPRCRSCRTRTRCSRRSCRTRRSRCTRRWAAAGVWAAQPEIREVDDLGDGPAYPVLTGDYAGEQARWASTPIEVGRPLAKPTPIFTKLDPKLGETGPEWAPIAR